MNQGHFDPWNDAAMIADRLAAPSSKLVLMLGAESWCETCRLFRPVFDAAAQRGADRKETWLWFDLEEHAEFLDDFIPNGLPLLVAYSGAQLTHAVIPARVSATAVDELLAQVSHVEHNALPDFRRLLMSANWAL